VAKVNDLEKSLCDFLPFLWGRCGQKAPAAVLLNGESYRNKAKTA
jgi:hypothetical protein